MALKCPDNLNIVSQNMSDCLINFSKNNNLKYGRNYFFTNVDLFSFFNWTNE